MWDNKGLLSRARLCETMCDSVFFLTRLAIAVLGQQAFGVTCVDCPGLDGSEFEMNVPNWITAGELWPKVICCAFRFGSKTPQTES